MRYGLTIRMDEPPFVTQATLAHEINVTGAFKKYSIVDKPKEFEELLSWDTTYMDTIGETVFLKITGDTTITIHHDVSQTVVGLFLICENNAHVKIKKTSSESTIVCADVIRVVGNTTITVVQDLHPNTANFQHRILSGTIKYTDVLLGSSYTKATSIARLQTSEQNCETTVLYKANATQQFDIYTESDHSTNNTYSNIVTRGVVDDSAKVLSRGLVKIQENAQGSNGYEQQDALILSEHAHAYAIPNLEIHNHDVKCSHGSTVGRIDEEKLFYIMSRGLNEKQAKEQIIDGYFNGILEEFSNV